MLVRRLVSSDAAAFQSLRLAGLRGSSSAFGSSYEEECDTPLSTIEARLAPDSGRNMFGAFDGDQLVGIVGVGRETALKVMHKAYVRAMYVAESHRGRGIGRRLMEHALAFASTLEGVQRMTISVTAGNAEAVGLYESLGFIEFGREPDSMIVDGRFHDEIMMSAAMPPAGTD
ncbi:GNAT family N-acetyltransferase [Duganella sp. BJB488]|uniref:GNAT family N-acetyltransferase n=1 Tax=unclassified Duganella TaxID=2636909 RepID=UPI000E3549EF|nr:MULTISPECIES: GNAT family N-acetyltransferase [unclassified Duganella]RFP15258.1 GNAT family N-acetyltransferase [Duganella sp. BJB489]RFP19814.1 GNAT family N-acetyltransferase [Duganella sp. BJB488]RFP38201.1 GNAT family N-acetyltransferase [Duganella sp. BJB480]